MIEKPLGRAAPALRARGLPSIHPTTSRLQVKTIPQGKHDVLQLWF